MTDPADILGAALASVTISRHAGGKYSLRAGNITIVGQYTPDELLEFARIELDPPNNVVPLRAARSLGGCGGLPCDSEPVDFGFEPFR